MFWKYVAIILVVGFIAAAIPEKPAGKVIDLRDTYRRACALFESPQPTAQTDSVALAGLLQVISGLPRTKANALILSDSYEKIGVLKQTYGQNREAIPYYQNAIATARQFRLSDSLQFKPLLYAGSAYYQLHSFDSSRYYFDKAEKVFQRFPGVQEAQRLYNSFGALYYEAGNYRQSINYFRKALQINLRRAKPDREQTYSYKSNIATSLRHLDEQDSAIAIYKSLLPLNVDKDELYVNLGTAYLEKKQSDSALFYFNQVKPSSPAKTILHENALGRAFLQKRDFRNAVAHLNQSLRLYGIENQRGRNSRKNYNAGLTYKLLGDIAQSQRQYQKALNFYHQSVIQLDYSFNDSVVRHNPKSFAEGFSRFVLFESLAAKAMTFYRLHQAESDLSHIDDALDAYRSAFRLAEYIEKSFDSDEARLFIVQKVLPVYEQAVDQMVEAYEKTRNELYLEAAFRISEKSKAAVLYISLKENESKVNTGLPDSLLTRERNLKYNLSRLSLRSDNAVNPAEAEALAAEIRDNELALSRLYDQLHDYPEYYRKKFNTDSIDVSYLRNRVLNPSMALLSFFQTDRMVYSFVITQDAIYHHRLPISRTYKQVLSALGSSLRDAVAGENYQGVPYSLYLHQKLIRPVSDKLTDVKSLIIIPHNELTLLPFDVLEDEQGRYLLEKYDITYQYAASFLRHDAAPAPDLGRTLAFAPFSSFQHTKEGGRLMPLPASELEIEHLQGTRLLDSLATKENFLRLSKSASVIHLATHAVANSDHPSRSFIAFYPTPGGVNRLYAHEIQYGTLSGAQLVFLSACETASGKMVRGEGVMSLSRAISYAGCSNLVTSLWKAEDNATAYISVRFYNYLRQGKTIGQSLRLAKLDLLQDEQFAQFHAPPYWSHLVYVGTPGQGDQPHAAWRWWLAGGMGLGLLVILARWLMLRRSASPVRRLDPTT